MKLPTYHDEEVKDLIYKTCRDLFVVKISAHGVIINEFHRKCSEVF